jgi:hypothetical protein
MCIIPVISEIFLHDVTNGQRVAITSGRHNSSVSRLKWK